MKDELNCSHNGGGVAYLLPSVAINLNPTVLSMSPANNRVQTNFIRTF